VALPSGVSLAKDKNPPERVSESSKGGRVLAGLPGPARLEVWAQCALAHAVKQGRPRRAGSGRLANSHVLEFGNRNGHAFGNARGPAQTRYKGEARMRMLLRDIMLFSCLVAFVAGLVIAAATLLI
jgi:hypothetical protein